MRTKYLTPEMRAAAAMKLRASAPAATVAPEITPPEVPSPTKDTETKETWKNYILPAVAGAGEIGAGIADVLAEGDEGAVGGNIPSGSSPVGIQGAAVGQPFSGRMSLSPQQRQSLALAMLGKMV